MQVLFVQCDVTKEEELVRYVEKLCLIVKLGYTLILFCRMFDECEAYFKVRFFQKKKKIVAKNVNRLLSHGDQR